MTLDSEALECLALEAIIASACEGLEVEAGPLVSSLRGRVEALYSRVGERLRDALHTTVKKALAMVSSHCLGIDLPVVTEGYVVSNDEDEAWEEV
jgi:hypothetical protein